MVEGEVSINENFCASPMANEGGDAAKELRAFSNQP